ncbi:MAG: hypothetical protein PHN55_13265 [Dysgonamonadaceae bacterium]|nr:hypothetical protein [Dysgonamonadaceae bacterium]
MKILRGSMRRSGMIIIDDSIILKYLNNEPCESYSNNWIYSAVCRGYLFNAPAEANRDWVYKLYHKLVKQINNYQPQNYELVKKLFPEFIETMDNYTIMLVVGFPDPYDAMMLEHDGKSYMIFDLIQFGKEALAEEYSCHRVLTHELLHMCIHNKYPKPHDLSYVDELNYTAFDEGVAHAVSYPEDINSFVFDSFLNEKYDNSKKILKNAVSETSLENQQEILVMADTGRYWDKFASISGKLYILKHIDNIENIYQNGWHNFCIKILDDKKQD